MLTVNSEGTQLDGQHMCVPMFMVKTELSCLNALNSFAFLITLLYFFILFFFIINFPKSRDDERPPS